MLDVRLLVGLIDWVATTWAKLIHRLIVLCVLSWRFNCGMNDCMKMSQLDKLNPGLRKC